MTGRATTPGALRRDLEDIRAGRLSVSDYVERFVMRVAASEPAVQAWESVDVDAVRAQALVADAVPSGRRGVLHGVPIGVKDIIDVSGLATRCGSSLTSAEPAASTAACVDALQHAGTIVMGKTVTTEYAYYQPGRTRNPWRATHTPGGSSSGSAAAVAAGMVPVALGTQTNGSIIRPAAFCGVVGYKPTLGAVSSDGILDPWPTLDHTGLFAGCVDDIAVVASVMVSGVGYFDEPPVLERSPVLLAVRSPVWESAQADQRETLLDATRILREAGARVVEIELPPDFSCAHHVMRTIMAFEAACHFSALQDAHRAGMSERLNRLIDEGRGVSRETYADAFRMRESLTHSFASFMSAGDAVITPPARGEAPATLDETGDPVFCTIWSLLGVPALTLPVRLGAGGLPLGLQVVASSGADGHLMQCAAWCEARLPWRHGHMQLPYGLSG